jgi:hypothetical protein
VSVPEVVGRQTWKSREGDQVPAVGAESSDTTLRSRLRSRKYLGGCSGCDTDRVLDLIAAQAELLGDRVDWLACPEQVDYVVDGGTAIGEPRTPEAVVGIDGHVRDLVLRQADQLRVAVDREIDAPQVEIDDLGEDTLVVADDDEFSRGVRLWSVACRSLRSLAASHWLIEHGFDPDTPGAEFDVLRSRMQEP